LIGAVHHIVTVPLESAGEALPKQPAPLSPARRMCPMTVSILILTLDEEVNIEACIASVSWSDDIVVLDSGSVDQTRALAEKAGARVFMRAFDNYAAQRNYGLNKIEWRHPWVLMLDADEIVPADLSREMIERVSDASSDTCLYRMRRKDFLFGTWIRGSGGYPTWFPRLARVGRTWVEREINEEYKTDGEIGELRAHLHHYPFNKGLSAWIAKHNRYSTMEAELLVRSACFTAPAPMRDVFSADPLRRRRALKALVHKMPMRPLVVFCAGYVLKRGFLEGRAGLAFSLLRSWYEFMIDVKVTELRRRAGKQPV